MLLRGFLLAAYLHISKYDLMKAIVCTFFLVIFCVTVYTQTSQFQLIHNAADTALAKVDVWLDSTKIYDNLSFRSATSFDAYPAEYVFELRICDSTSSDTTNPILLLRDSLYAGQNAIFMLAGVADTSIYESAEKLEFHKLIDARLQAEQEGYTDLVFFNGITDMDTVGIAESRHLLGSLVGQLPYGAFSPYVGVETYNYRFRILHNGLIWEYEAPLPELNFEDSVAVVFTSGFRNPASNANGLPTALCIARTDGTVVELNRSMARVQFIHNSADSSISSLDVYVNQGLRLNDFEFRLASGFLNVPSSENVRFYLCADSSQSSANPLAMVSVNLEADKHYVAIISGMIDNQMMPFEPLTLLINETRTQAGIGSQTDVLFFAGATDFTSTTIRENHLLKSEIFSGIDFGAFSQWQSLPFANYKIELLDDIDQSVFQSFNLDLFRYELEGDAIVLMTSGFADTNVTSGSELMSLWFARPVSGKLIELSQALGELDLKKKSLRIFPNPVADELTMVSNEPIHAVSVYNTQGKQVLHHHGSGHFSVQILTSDLPSGIYHIRIEGAVNTQSAQVVVQH